MTAKEHNKAAAPGCVLPPPATDHANLVDSACAPPVYGARIWLTRARFPYDHWLPPGEMLRVYRGERLWLSADGGNAAARVMLTSAWRPPAAPAGWRSSRCVSRASGCGRSAIEGGAAAQASGASRPALMRKGQTRRPCGASGLREAKRARVRTCAAGRG
ncbi:DUF2917 domain-containing protein [Paraburkholderia silviterrae]|uniref:DUF2917 domain-containing protein n=1 Tax=Paraburkholderia silviterrae TaxID=2528715 RepID=A0A4R5MGN3_9BURK|nr:DUF2917 domain-containing protein [Paraburkholderia silviterrae]